MSVRRQIQGDELAEIEALIHAGRSTAEIALRMDRARASIRAIRRRLGVPNPNIAPSLSGNAVSKKVRAEKAFQRMSAALAISCNGGTREQAMDATGLSYSGLHTLLKKYTGKTAWPIDQNFVMDGPSPESRYDEVDRRLIAGESIRDVFISLRTGAGLTRDEIAGRRRVLAAQGLVAGFGAASLTSDERDLIAWMIDEGKTNSEIVTATGRSPATVKRIVARHGRKKTGYVPEPDAAPRQPRPRLGGCAGLLSGIAQHHPDAATRFTMPAERSRGAPMTAYQIAAQLPWLRWAA